MYTPFKARLLRGQVADLSAAGTDVRALFVDNTNYTPSQAHEFLSSIPAASRIGPNGTSPAAASGGVALVSKTVTANLTAAAVNGVPAWASAFDAADTTFTAVATSTPDLVVIYLATAGDATGATSPLIACFDGVTVTANGGDLTVVWGAGTAPIFTF